MCIGNRANSYLKCRGQGNAAILFGLPQCAWGFVQCFLLSFLSITGCAKEAFLHIKITPFPDELLMVTVLCAVHLEAANPRRSCARATRNHFLQAAFSFFVDLMFWSCMNQNTCRLETVFKKNREQRTCVVEYMLRYHPVRLNFLIATFGVSGENFACC